MTSNLLTIDLGTSWAKAAVYAAEGAALRLLDTVRLPSGIGAYCGTPHCLQRFVALCAQLQQIVAGRTREYSVRRVGLTGIREGLVLLDEHCRPLSVSGNAVLDGDDLLSKTIGEIEIAPLLPGMLDRHPETTTVVTLQGYLAGLLTGRFAITRSELSAFGVLEPREPLSAAVRAALSRTEVVGIGASLGNCREARGADVYLAGTDEHASHYGAGLGGEADLGLATATFWSLTAPAAPGAPRLPEIRYIPEVHPYPACASIIGYRWGPYLQEALEGRVPQFPPQLPRWAVGRLLQCLRAGEVSREALVEAAAADIRAAADLLGQVGRLPRRPTLVVHGGGLTGLRPFTEAVLERVGYPWAEREGDATQLGCCRAGLVAAEH